MLIDFIIYIVTLIKYKKKDLLSYDDVRYLLIANYIGVIISIFDSLFFIKGSSLLFSKALLFLFPGIFEYGRNQAVVNVQDQAIAVAQQQAGITGVEVVFIIISIMLCILLLGLQINQIKKLRELKSELVMSSVYYCKNCGSAIPAGNDFCTNCGYTLNESEENKE